MTTRRARGAEPPRLLGRREALVVLGVGGVGVAALWRTPLETFRALWRALVDPAPGVAAECVLAPEQTAGPFYVANEPLRRDIAEGRAGVALRLVLTVRDATTCRPLRGVDVEVWHCDADGIYSGVAGPADTS